jgi:hypothetical protein
MANSSLKPIYYREVTTSHLRTLQTWVEQPWVSYVMLFLLQLKVVWGMWQYRDLTAGDTSSYFSIANLWFNNFQVDITWSPLYTAFYGTLSFLSSDAYMVTILHRLIIVFVLTLLVLALMRRLLPASIAWLMAAWWALLPNNFDTFEVHLFAVIPVLAAWLLILYRPNSWTRGGAIAILFASSILVRNELIVATGLLTMICLYWEIRIVRKEGEHVSGVSIGINYGLPLLFAGVVCFFFYTRSVIQFPELPTAYAPKHTVNMCQAYSFGYKQRHPEWNKDHWTECGDLMLVEFGKRFPSLGEMIRENPTAVLGHVLWNISLVPSGIQVSLFGATSGTVSPDYIPVMSGSSTALSLSVIVGSTLVLGMYLLYRDWRHWWPYWLKDRALGWLAMLATVAVVVFVVIPTQRPRPEYLYLLSIVLMALTGMSLWVIIDRWFDPKKLSGWVPVVMVAIVLAAPSFYTNPNSAQPRPLLQLYRRLIPFQSVIARPDTVFLKGESAFDVSGYVGYRLPTVLDYGVLGQIPVDMSIEEFLSKQGINLIYLDENLMTTLRTTPSYQEFLASPEARGWKIIAFQDGGDARWMLFQKIQE